MFLVRGGDKNLHFIFRASSALVHKVKKSAPKVTIRPYAPVSARRSLMHTTADPRPIQWAEAHKRKLLLDARNHT